MKIYMRKFAMKRDRDFYSEKGIEERFDNDELDAGEEGFMKGYLAADKL